MNKLQESESGMEKKCNLSFKRDEIKQRVLRLLFIVEPTALQKSKKGKI